MISLIISINNSAVWPLFRRNNYVFKIIIIYFLVISRYFYTSVTRSCIGPLFQHNRIAGSYTAYGMLNGFKRATATAFIIIIPGGRNPPHRAAIRRRYINGGRSSLIAFFIDSSNTEIVARIII